MRAVGAEGLRQHPYFQVAPLPESGTLQGLEASKKSSDCTSCVALGWRCCVGRPNNYSVYQV